jgi:uncharacterized membrane protein YadS
MVNLNRVVAFATALLALILGLLPLIANLDWTSTTGIAASLAVVLGIVYKWLDGWQKHEEQNALLAPPVVELDVGDAGQDPLPPPVTGVR